jgi:hypothetical protein
LDPAVIMVLRLFASNTKVSKSWRGDKRGILP